MCSPLPPLVDKSQGEAAGTREAAPGGVVQPAAQAKKRVHKDGCNREEDDP